MSGRRFVFVREGAVMATEQKARFTRVASGFDLPELEHGVLDLWDREKSFDALRQKNAGGPRYSFIDGPITANIEAMGVHHAFFFQAEDGIRDLTVTGVQTCALPI